MTRLLSITLAIFLPLTAHAHVGHLGELAGHDHLVAGVAIGIAIALGLREALKGTQEVEDTPEEDPEEAEAPA